MRSAEAVAAAAAAARTHTHTWPVDIAVESVTTVVGGLVCSHCASVHCSRSARHSALGCCSSDALGFAAAALDPYGAASISTFGCSRPAASPCAT